MDGRLSGGSGSAELLLERFKAVRQMETAMDAMEEPEAFLGCLLDSSLPLFKAETGAVFLPRPSGPGMDSFLRRGIEAADGLSIEADAAPTLPGALSVLSVPIVHAGSTLALLVLGSPRPDAFAPEDADILAGAAAQAGRLLQRARLKGELGRKIRLKDILLTISRAVECQSDLKEVFETAMRQLAERFGILRGMLVLFGHEGPETLSIHSAYNLTEEEISRGVYRVGEGVIGKAVERGVAVAIPDIRQDASFLNRTRIKRRKDVPTSFIAAPFALDGRPAGVIAVEKVFESEEVLADEKDLVLLVGSIIAAKVQAFQRLSVERERLEAENESLKTELKRRYATDAIVCKNRKMTEILDLAGLVADSATSIMLLGESGTGKEMIARLIHDSSPRRGGPFISVNCAAIPDNLLESELFGHKRGSFTGAVQDRKGKFQLADGGTIFLDEIGDMPMQLQVKLLRAVQEREIEPVGSERRERIDVRFVAATNRDLSKLIREGKFREDLYYRLNVVEIRLPPLRERPDDVPFLAAHFLKKYAASHGRAVEGLSPQAMRLLQTYAWPGNVRELENVIERAVLLCRSGSIEAAHLPATLMQGAETPADGRSAPRWVEAYLKGSPSAGKAWDEVIGSAERELIQQAMLLNGRNKVRTADFLGINRNTLRAKIELYGLE